MTDGNPISDAAIELKIRRYHPTKTLIQDDLVCGGTTDEVGTYILQLAGSINQKYDRVQIKASKVGYVTDVVYDHTKEILQGTLPELALYKGKTLTGRVVDAKGTPVAAARFRVQSCNEDLSHSWDSGPQTVKADGSFSLLVPIESAVAGVIYPKNYAPRHFELKDNADLGELIVSTGVRLRGRVLDRRGKGVSGTIVGIRDTKQLVLHAYHVPIGMAVRTDEEGHFRFAAFRRRVHFVGL